jgi:hypothetical protein
MRKSVPGKFLKFFCIDAKGFEVQPTSNQFIVNAMKTCPTIILAVSTKDISLKGSTFAIVM